MQNLRKIAQKLVWRQRAIKKIIENKKVEYEDLFSKQYLQVNNVLAYRKKIKYVAGGIAGTYLAYVYGTRRVETITVKSKLPLYGDGRTTLMISAKGNKFYRVRNSYWHFQLRALELYGALEEGKKYTVTTYGFRIRPFHIYPNIVKAVET